MSDATSTPPGGAAGAAAPVNLPALVDRFQQDSLATWHDDSPLTDKRVIRLALFFLVFVVGFGGIWASTAQLGGAVIASGTVIAEGRNRIIQHLEGGILKDILVREGDSVKAGQSVAILDTTQASAQLRGARLQDAILRIQLARRRAEVTERRSFDIPEAMSNDLVTHPRVLETVESQRSEFEASRRLLDTQLEIIDGLIKAAEGRAEGSREVLAAVEKQRDLLQSELDDLQTLYEKELIRRSEIFSRQRALADLEGQIASVKADIKQAEGEAINQRNERQQARLEYLRDANQQLVSLQQQLNDEEQIIERLSDQVNRSVIASPVPGTVFQIGRRTLGAVLSPGEQLMTIFPKDDALAVEALIEPKDIEQVYIGQEVQVIFPSNRDNKAPVNGAVTYLSADSVTNQETGFSHYVAHVVIHPGQEDEFNLLPGNQAEVYLQTEPKTFFEYVTEPVTNFAFRVFKG